MHACDVKTIHKRYRVCINFVSWNSWSRVLPHAQFSNQDMSTFSSHKVNKSCINSDSINSIAAKIREGGHTKYSVNWKTVRVRSAHQKKHQWRLHSCCSFCSWARSHHCPSEWTTSSWRTNSHYPGRQGSESRNPRQAPGDQGHPLHYLYNRMVCY